eukprot:scaffold4749_cov89-Cylindrotheca_fusiformis.AAC.1
MSIKTFSGRNLPANMVKSVIVGGKDFVDKSQPELTILAPTRREKNKRATNEQTSVKWANVTWAKILGNSQEQGTRDVMRHRVNQRGQRFLGIPKNKKEHVTSCNTASINEGKDSWEFPRTRNT